MLRPTVHPLNYAALPMVMHSRSFLEMGCFALFPTSDPYLHSSIVQALTPQTNQLHFQCLDLVREVLWVRW